MKVAAPALLPVFRSRLLGDLLALVLGEPERSWTVSELSRRVGAPYQTVSKEVRRLKETGVVTTREVGRSRLIRANGESPYVGPLTELVALAFGPPAIVEAELGKVAGVDRLFIYGSWAARHAGEPGPPPNDIDVLVLGKPDRDDLYDAARRAEQHLGREVNVTIRPTRAWPKANDGFARTVKSRPLLELAGSDGDLV